MTLLEPWSALLAAAIGVSALIGLYILKLRRYPVRISSTLLWQSAIEDLLANAPFRRLRLSRLFFIQLLAILLASLALGRPVTSGSGLASGRTILLLDRSASMSAKTAAGDLGRIRLQIAKDKAGELVDRLFSGGQRPQVLIIGIDAEPKVLLPFTTDRRQVMDAVAAISPTDQPADLEGAFALADAFARQGESSDNSPPDVVLISDGALPIATQREGYSVRCGQFQFIRVDPGDSGQEVNRGIVDFRAARSPTDRWKIDVFARVINTQAEPFTTSVSIRSNGQLVGTRVIELPAAVAQSPGEAVLTAQLEEPAPTTLVIGLDGADALDADQTASAVIPAPAPPRVAVVATGSRPDTYLLRALENIGGETPSILSREAFMSRLDERPIPWDLVVLDRIPLKHPPPFPTLSFNATVDPEMMKIVESQGGHRVLSWNRTDPLLEQVDLSAVVFADVASLETHGDVEELALSREGPVIGRVSRDGIPHVVVAFAISRSNWFLQPGFVIFLQNCIDRLAVADSVSVAGFVRTDEPWRVEPAPGAADLVLQRIGPDGADLRFPTHDLRQVQVPPLPRVGVYAVNGAARADRLAVNLVNQRESDIRGRNDLVVNSNRQSAGTVAKTAQREWWPWVVAAMLVILALEWLYWLSRTRR